MASDNLEQLVIASRAVREARAARDAILRQARQDGATLRALATAADLTPQGVKLICDRPVPGP